MPTVIDNILPAHLERDVYDTLMGNHMPWYYNESTSGRSSVYGAEPEHTVETFQFTHNFIVESKVTSSLSNLAWSTLAVLTSKFDLDMSNAQRVKANLMTSLPGYKQENFNPIHADCHDLGKWKSILYYVNDCDGDTTFFEEQYPQPRQDLTKMFTSTPRRNTAVCFPSQMFHCGANPIINNKRVVINYVIEVR